MNIKTEPLNNTLNKTLFIHNLIKFSFILSMINDGWRFRQISNNSFEFKKSRSLCKNINLNNYLSKHFKNIAFI
jgi:hypothetical protein